MQGSDFSGGVRHQMRQASHAKRYAHPPNMGLFSKTRSVDLVTARARAAGTVSTPLGAGDLRWPVPPTNTKVHVSTWTLYFGDATGCGFVQLVSSSAFGHKTYQANVHVYKGESHWLTDEFSGEVVREEGDVEVYRLGGKGSVELTIDRGKQTWRAVVKTLRVAVDVRASNTLPCYKVADDGCSHYLPGDRVVRHKFFPRVHVEGLVAVDGCEAVVDGPGHLVDALQGLKPYRAASRWQFATIHTARSINLMQYVTPTGVTVTTGGVVGEGNELQVFLDGEVAITWTGTAQHGSGWSYPTGATLVAGDVVAECKSLALLTAHDVLENVPAVLKSLVGASLHIKPYVFQLGGEWTVAGQRGYGIFEVSYVEAE